MRFVRFDGRRDGTPRRRSSAGGRSPSALGSSPIALTADGAWPTVVFVRNLEDVKVVDGEPVAAGLIPRALTAGELVFGDGSTQTFDGNGDTSYVEADGRATRGRWYVDEDGRFCSFWPPSYRACYELVWTVEGDVIVGLRFGDPGRGTQFEGRYSAPAHRAGK
jgi:hypothetical protein